MNQNNLNARFVRLSPFPASTGFGSLGDWNKHEHAVASSLLNSCLQLFPGRVKCRRNKRAPQKPLLGTSLEMEWGALECAHLAPHAPFSYCWNLTPWPCRYNDTARATLPRRHGEAMALLWNRQEHIQMSKSKGNTKPHHSHRSLLYSTQEQHQPPPYPLHHWHQT